VQVVANAGFAAAGHLTDRPLKPTSAGVTASPSAAATFSTQTVPATLLVVNLPPMKGGWPSPVIEVAGV
jgi:hypothetical protein